MFRNTYPYKEDKKMKLNNFVTKETLSRLQKFGHKVSKMAQELLEAPDAIKLIEFVSIRTKYEEEAKHFFDLTVEEARKATLILPKAILVTKGGNQANPEHSEKQETIDDSNITIAGSLSAEISRVDYVYEQGTTRGSRAQNLNKTSKKQLLDQYVAKLRRILYWAGKTVQESEAFIDAKLLQQGVSGYQKTKRNPNYRYRPVIIKP
jgi:hypothetical protein